MSHLTLRINMAPTLRIQNDKKITKTSDRVVGDTRQYLVSPKNRKRDTYIKMYVYVSWEKLIFDLRGFSVCIVTDNMCDIFQFWKIITSLGGCGCSQGRTREYSGESERDEDGVREKCYIRS